MSEIKSDRVRREQLVIYEFYQDASGLWRWRKKRRNGRVTADGAESYKTKAGVLRAIDQDIRGAHQRIELRERKS